MVSVRFSRSKSNRFYMKKIFFKHALFETGRRRINSVLLKKRGEAEPSEDDMNHPFFLRQGSYYHFRRNWIFFSISRVPMCFHALFLGTHTIKKDNGNPTMNYFIFIYELI